MTRRAIVMGAVLAGLAGAAVAGPQGEPPKQARQVSLYSDVKARGVGDIVTVAIIERASASNSAQLSTRRSTKFDTKASEGTGALSFVPEMGMSAQLDRNHEGSGQLSREGRLTARMAATVTEVKPNGDLVISGQREVQTNDEKEILQLSGTVRPDDIGPGNVVYSTDVADAKIVYKGKGQLTKGTRPSVIGWLFSWLF